MKFGNTESFVLDAIIEPGPEYPPTFGSNIAGRARLVFGDHVVGDFEEPCCVLGPLSEHLVELCSNANSLWHESLEGRTPSDQFKLLNNALFVDEEPETPNAYNHLIFLTNVSEIFDGVKGFLLGPPGEPLRALLCIGESEEVHCHLIPRGDFCSVSAQFALWVKEQEYELLQHEA